MADSTPNKLKRDAKENEEEVAVVLKKVKLDAVSSTSSPAQATLKQTTLSFAPKPTSKPTPAAEEQLKPPPIASVDQPAPVSAVEEPPKGEVDAFDGLGWLEQLPKTATNANAPSTKDLLTLEATTLDPSWLVLLKDELVKSYFLGLKRFLWSEGVRNVNSTGKVYPPANEIYSWSHYTPLHRVSCVILGQDPYHGEGQAHGAAFSVKKGVKVPPSLRNMYKELANDYADFKAPAHGNLVSWAEHGVLLLNTSLTVQAGKAGSHSKKGWETFTDKLIALVDEFGGSGEVGKKGSGVVFLAWGAPAAQRVASLDSNKHLILKSVHPSPLSAHRGFFGNQHFKKTNEWLVSRGKEPIPWTELGA